MPVESSTSTDLPQPRLSLRRHWASEQAISYLMTLTIENPELISLAAGFVDPSTLPVEETREAVAALLADDERAREVLQYGTTAGAECLRRELLGHLSRQEQCAVADLGIDADQLILTTGSQQFLSLMGEVLLDPGDICLVAGPTYFVFLSVLNGLGARAVPVATDAGGMCPVALEAELVRLEAAGELDRVKFIYLVSYYENPSGISLALDRREKMVEIAKRWSKQHRLFILEDAAYRELRYDGPLFPSLWSFDEGHDSVVLAQTFSKSFSPGLRVGYGIVPKDLLAPLCDRKGNEDFGSANFNQHVIATMLERGLYESHVEKVRDSYRTKRDCMLAAADTYFADIPGIEWVHPHGGLYVWMTLPERIETGFGGELFERALKIEQVMYVPGELCYVEDKNGRLKNQMRLSFGVEDPPNIETGMKRLAAAVRAVL